MKQKQLVNIILSGCFILVLVVLYSFFLTKHNISTFIYSETIDISTVKPTDLAKKKLITTTFDKLYYTGYSYHRDGATAGSYYYYIIPNTTDNNDLMNRYLLVLVKGGHTATTLSNYTCSCKITTKDGSLENIASSIANDTGIAYTDMSQMIQPFLLNEADYPTSELLITKILLAASILAIICYLALWIRDIIVYYTKSKQRG